MDEKLRTLIETHENVNLDLPLVDEIKGLFYIPSYQRGYRWGRDEVSKMINDIYKNGANPYCLQPIVVKNIGNDSCTMVDGRKLDLTCYELIDGQQRLTTLFLIYNYIRVFYKPKIRINFLIDYKTRTNSRTYLLNPTKEDAGKNIDFHYINEAYDTIDKFFNNLDNPSLVADDIYSFLCKQVKVIWYEVKRVEPVAAEGGEPSRVVHAGRDQSIDLFIRLNIGRIALNNAELVKAIFLSRDNGLAKEMQLEIATSWDIIEHELHAPELWAFLTNAPGASYASRIELLFDMIAHKQPEQSNEFFTFEYFMSQVESKDGEKRDKTKRDVIAEEWAKVQKDFLRLKGWFEDHELYHKIGFLVAVGRDLRTLLDSSKEMTKKTFRNSLDQAIMDELRVSRDEFLSLNYLKDKDKDLMEKILLLFNVESICCLKNSTERYSFSAHKSEAGWSLDHIHAQESEGLNTAEDWIEWLQEHRKALVELVFIHPEAKNSETLKANRDVLVESIDTAIRSITRTQFMNLFPRVVSILSENGDLGYLHTMANMALLGRNMNSAFNNSTFAVKRAKMLDKDRLGEYIPICTRRVFLKYYTETGRQQLSFWGKLDRDSYIEKLVGTDKNPEKGMITRYLSKPQEKKT